MNVLIPLPVTDAVFASSTIAEPAAGETVWVSGGVYALDARCIRPETHRVYKSLIAHSGITVAPEVDTTRWLDDGPTLKWAMFDTQVSTQSIITTPLTVVLRPGFFNAVGLYGPEGGTATITVKDAPGGSVIDSRVVDLIAPPLGWYDWAFGRIRPLEKVLVSGFTPYPEAELTISITAGTGVAVKCGMAVVGDYRSLLEDGDWGGALAGATVEPVDFSYIKTDSYGNTSIKRRRSATDMRIKIIMPRKSADQALEAVQEVLAVPCAWVATALPGYAGLNVFGLGSAVVSYDGDHLATLSLYVKGLV